MAPQIGQLAPDFKAQAYHQGNFTDISLSDYRGKWVILFFYPLDFTFVCPTEIQGFNQHLSAFKAANAEVMSVSVDSIHAHKAWSEGSLGMMNYPMVSDMTQRISRDYGVLSAQGISFRGVFIVDPEGVLRSYQVNDLSVGRSVEEILRTVQAFQTGELCPVGWKPGEKTLGKA
jgi:peroxiredoxin 2/4